MKAEVIAEIEHGRKTSRGWLIRCPAHDDRTPSCSIADGERGLLIKCHAGCSQVAVVAAAKARGWMDRSAEIPHYKEKARYQPQKAEERPPDPRALEIWSAAGPVQGTIAEAYLAGRGLTAPAGDAVLRSHPSCPFKLENGTTAFPPAMIGLFRDIPTNEPCGIHRTALKPDGSGKADMPGLGNAKKMLGRAKGAAIKLSGDAEVTLGLGIAEGIETALTAYCANWRPVWALGSAGAISTFPVLVGIETLTIFADADPAGIKAAKACQERWLQAGRECRIILPPDDGQDWNDVARTS